MHDLSVGVCKHTWPLSSGQIAGYIFAVTSLLQFFLSDTSSPLLQLRVHEAKSHLLSNWDPQTHWQGKSLHCSVSVHHMAPRWSCCSSAHTLKHTAAVVLMRVSPWNTNEGNRRRFSSLSSKNLLLRFGAQHYCITAIMELWCVGCFCYCSGANVTSSLSQQQDVHPVSTQMYAYALLL